MSVPAPEETSGFSLIITVTVQPDKYDEWLRLSWETFKLVTAETDCLSFEMFSVPGEPNKVKWVESWSKSLEAVMAVSFSSPLVRSFQTQSSRVATRFSQSVLEADCSVSHRRGNQTLGGGN